MIKLQYDEIKFYNKTVLESGEIMLEDQALIILKGESGSGKSTLIQTLTLHNSFTKSYQIDDIEIMDMKEEQKSNILYNHFAFVNQQDVLLEDLKINDQIALLQDITKTNVDIKKWTTAMDMEGFLDKYPAQLSGGELKRASILLALVKYPKYLILDEPTASLDEKNREIILNVLKEYVHEGNTVLASTHDSGLVEHADIVYEIEDKQLHKISHRNNIIKEKPSERSIGKNINDIYGYFRKMKLHRKKYTRVLNIISILCIAFVSFAFTFNNAAYSVQTKQMEEMQTKQIIVYKKFYETKIAEAYSFGAENIIEKNELAKLHKVDHIKYINWRFDADVFDPIAKPLSTDYANIIENRPAVTLIDNDKVEKEYFGESVIESTFVKNYDYSKDIDYQFQDDGVYISSYLASKLSTNLQDLKGKQIKTYLMVPIASSYGAVYTASPEGGTMFIDYPACKTIEVTLPIAGILETASMGVRNQFSDTIYFEQKIFEKYLKEEEVTSYDKFYIMDDSFKEIYVNELPKDITSKPKYVAQYSKWTPTAYTVTVDSLDHMGEVIQDITKLGFDVDYAYGNYKAMSETTKNMQKGIRTASIAVGSIVLLAFLVMKYNEREAERKVNAFFYEMLFTTKEIRKIKYKKNLSRSFTVMVLSSGFMALLLIVCNFLQVGFTSFQWNMFMIIILLSLLLEFILPVLFESIRENKKI